ncbi:F-box domain-containing protein [Mycena venus]|uniref:F-box domain-containing protein n=1 Tax=Mycena venus TaxID=2733690 RepID=A0A8H6YCB5_9AGAR|nr:F-box domain-containing protein [Mycena venus]
MSLTRQEDAEPPAVDAGRDLPFELRSKIFLHCLPSNGRVRPSPQAAPLLLAQVCREWRAVALASPQLWSSIFLEFPGSSNYDGLASLFGYEATASVDPTTALVDLWFSRARGYPLSVTLRCCKDGIRLPLGLVAVLKTMSTQWERLELMLSRIDFLELTSVSGPFPCLRYLAIGLTPGPWIPDFVWNPALYISTNAPDLATLRLGYFAGMYPLSPIADNASPTRSLTTLEFSLNDAAKAVVVFELFPDLRHLILHIDFSLFGDPPGAEPVPVTAHLSCLILDGNVDLLAHVTIPTLEHLGVTIWDVRGASAIVSALIFNLAHGLLSFPWQIPSTRLNSWIQHSTSATAVASFRIDDPPYKEFLEILEARRRTLPRAHLRIAREHHSHPDDEFLARLRDLTAEGMVITLQTPRFRWPASCCDNLDGDYNIFNPEEPLPSSISEN